MSKGSKQRPKFITEEEFNNNWDRIFIKYLADRDVRSH